MLIQLALLLADQPQPDVVVTFRVPVPPPKAKDWDVGEMLYVQAGPGLICSSNP
jgi:hypothetical protein